MAGDRLFREEGRRKKEEGKCSHKNIFGDREYLNRLGWWLLGVNSQPSTANCQLSTVNCQPTSPISTIRWNR